MDFKPIVQGFTLDSISKVAFGLETKTYRGENQEFAQIAKDVVDQFTVDSWAKTMFFNLFNHFPEVFANMGFWPESAVKIRKMTEDVISERDSKNITVGDFVDRLREFRAVAQAPITNGMISAQGMVFLTAGFETTANTIGSMICLIANHPDIQERIVNEINDHIGSDEITHENIKLLDYLEACIMETLRLCPPIVEHQRSCTNDTVVNGIKIKKGTKIQMPIYASHYCPDFYPEPEKYKPERFLKENSDQIIPFTWRPFGAGNRNCIGQRFAIMEIKIFMAKFLTKYKLIPTKDTRFKYFPSGFLLAYPEMVAKIEDRV
jgi:cytochrome P450